MSNERMALEELALDGQISLAPAGGAATRFFNCMKEIAEREGYPPMEYDKKTATVTIKHE